MENQYQTVVLRKNGPRSGKGMNARALAGAKASGSIATVKRGMLCPHFSHVLCVWMCDG